MTTTCKECATARRPVLPARARGLFLSLVRPLAALPAAGLAVTAGGVPQAAGGVTAVVAVPGADPDGQPVPGRIPAGVPAVPLLSGVGTGSGGDGAASAVPPSAPCGAG